MQTRAKNKITNSTQKLTLLATPETKPIVPTTVAQAMRDPNWRQSMEDEYNAQIKNHMFELVPPRPEQHVIATKWVHTVKYSPDGTIRRYKSRWVARGFRQEYENVRSGALRVTHVSTKDQLADVLTKPLPRPHFTELIRKIGVVSLPPS
ncbi:hypothetical protein Bca4012_003974 [Brassica carinata]